MGSQLLEFVSSRGVFNVWAVPRVVAARQRINSEFRLSRNILVLFVGSDFDGLHELNGFRAEDP
jgi:hypothetical protein